MGLYCTTKNLNNSGSSHSIMKHVVPSPAQLSTVQPAAACGPSRHLGLVVDHAQAVPGDVQDAAQRTPALRLWAETDRQGQTRVKRVTEGLDGVRWVTEGLDGSQTSQTGSDGSQTGQTGSDGSQTGQAGSDGSQRG